jgi:hypothetical protein
MLPPDCVGNRFPGGSGQGDVVKMPAIRAIKGNVIIYGGRTRDYWITDDQSWSACAALVICSCFSIRTRH